MKRIIMTCVILAALALPAASQTLYVGKDAGTDETYVLASVPLNTTYSYVGYYGKGTFTQFSGTHTIVAELLLGNYSGSEGVYNFRNGTLTVPSISVGVSGTGTMTQSGGTATFANYGMYFGENSGSHGSYNLSGNGSLVVKATDSVEYIGYSGQGSFTQDGGSHTLGGSNMQSHVYLGYNSGAQGSYLLKNGLLTLGGASASTQSEIVGRNGTGDFTQEGGSHTITSKYDTNLSLAIGTSSRGTYTLSGGTFSMSGSTNYIYVGQGTSSTATFQVSGGDFSTTAGSGNANQLYVGSGTNAAGTLKVSNGSFQMNTTTSTGTTNVYLGSNSGSRGIIEVTGGLLSISSISDTGAVMHVGENTGSRGEINQSGGEIRVSHDVILGQFGGTGYYRLTGGTTRVGRSFLVSSGTSYLTTAGAAGTAGLNVGGDYVNGTTDAAHSDLSRLVLTMAGGKSSSQFQVFSQPWVRDLGATWNGLDGNYALNKLVLGDGLGTADNYAYLDSTVYTYGLEIKSDAVVDLGGHTIYYVPTSLSYNGITGSGLNISGSWSNGNIVPIPEPATLSLVGLGLAGLVMRRRRK